MRTRRQLPHHKNIGPDRHRLPATARRISGKTPGSSSASSSMLYSPVLPALPPTVPPTPRSRASSSRPAPVSALAIGDCSIFSRYRSSDACVPALATPLLPLPPAPTATARICRPAHPEQQPAHQRPPPAPATATSGPPSARQLRDGVASIVQFRPAARSVVCSASGFPTRGACPCHRLRRRNFVRIRRHYPQRPAVENASPPAPARRISENQSPPRHACSPPAPGSASPSDTEHTHTPPTPRRSSTVASDAPLPDRGARTSEPLTASPALPPAARPPFPSPAVNCCPPPLFTIAATRSGSASMSIPQTPLLRRTRPREAGSPALAPEYTSGKYSFRSPNGRRDNPGNSPPASAPCCQFLRRQARSR